jgi:hypothetical protein
MCSGNGCCGRNFRHKGCRWISKSRWWRYENDANNINIDIIDEKEVKPLKSIFENDSGVKYTTVAGKINNRFNYTDGVNEQAGIDELVKSMTRNT